MKTSPISFASSVPFPREAKEIGDVCTQAKIGQCSRLFGVFKPASSKEEFIL